MARTLRAIAGIGLALGLAAGGTTAASAHATLISSNPGNGAVLASAPDEVMLQFDVPVNPRLSVAHLQDPNGRRIGDLTIDAGAGVSSLLTIDLPDLPQGVYRLDFHARDDTDLHETGGVIVFGVGAAADQQVQQPVAPGPSYIETGTRWLELAGTCLLVGIVTVWLGILPALGRRRALSVSARNRLLAIAMLGYVAIVLGKAGQLLVAAGGLAGGATSWPDAMWTALSAGRFGVLWLAGLGCAAVVVIAVRGTLARSRSRLIGAALVLATTALLVLSTATSHGANQGGPDPLLIAIRVVHLGAAGLWVGGLTVLVFLFAGALRGGSPDGPAALTAFRRFTGLAFIAVGVLTVSGLLLVGRGVGSPAQLVTTSYGLTLVAKLIAGAAAIGFGIRHTLLLTPRRGRGLGGTVKLERSVPFEVGTMLVVLWGAAALGATAPAPMAAPAASVGPALEADTTAQVDDLVVHTSMAPGHPGPNTLLVQVRDAGPATSQPVSLVDVTLLQPGHAPTTMTGRDIGRGRYEFPPARVAATGRLYVTVAITRADGTRQLTDCIWMVSAPPPGPPPGLPATPWGPALEATALGLAVTLLCGLGALLVVSRLRRLTTSR
jgi:copper transport protein